MAAPSLQRPLLLDGRPGRSRRRRPGRRGHSGLDRLRFGSAARRRGARRERALLEEISKLGHVHFSERARKRARSRRLRGRAVVTGWLAAGVVAAAFGVRIPDGLGLMTTVETRVLEEVDADGLETSDTASSLTRFTRKVYRSSPATPAPEETSDAAAVPPTSALPALPLGAGSVEQVIYAAAAEFGLSGEYLLSVARCESNLDPRAYNAAGYHGLFQFDSSTWSAYGYGDIYDPVAQARTTARLLAAGQSSRWPNCA